MSGTVLHTSLVMWLIWRAVISLKFQACLTYPSIHPLRSHLSWSWQLAFYRVDGWMSTSHLFHCVPPSNSLGCTAKVQCGALLKGTSVGQCEVFHFSGNILTQRDSPLLSSPLGWSVLRRTPPSVTPGSDKSDVFFAFPAPERETETERSVGEGERQPEVCAREVKISGSGLRPGRAPSSWNPCILTSPPARVCPSSPPLLRLSPAADWSQRSGSNIPDAPRRLEPHTTRHTVRCNTG